MHLNEENTQEFRYSQLEGKGDLLSSENKEILIDTTPRELVYEGYKNWVYSLWFALGELVDNSITSAYQNWERLQEIEGGGYRLRIDITIDQAQRLLSVEDNAAGITQEQFSRILVAGERPDDPSGLSVHGVGMKLAAFWWGRTLAIYSNPVDKEYSVSALMDLDEMKSRGDANATCTIGKRLIEWHGTRIILRNAYENRWPEPSELNNLSLLLRSMYRAFTLSEEKPVDLFLNGTRLDFEPFPLLEAPFWRNTSGPVEDAEPKVWRRDDFQFTTSTGRRISGWYGIFSQIKRDLSGFFLHFRGKGMQGIGYAGSAAFNSEEESEATQSNQYYRPQSVFGSSETYRFGRFTGEFDITDFGKAASTDSAVWSKAEEREFLAALVEDMKSGDENFWTMAAMYQPRKASRLKKEKDDATVSPAEIRDLGDLLFKGWHGDGVVHEDDIEDSDTSITPLLDELEAEDIGEMEFVTVSDEDGHDHLVVLELAENPELELYSFSTDAADGNRHVLRLNVGHPVLRKLQWSSKYVREAALTMTLLMSLPEIFLAARVNRSAFRAKINEMAQRLAERAGN